MHPEHPLSPESLTAALTRTAARLREAHAMLALLVSIQGHEIGFHSFQLRLPADTAFALREHLPAGDPTVVITYEDGDILLTVL